LGGLLRGNLGNLVLYFLFRIVLAIAICVIVVGVVLVTCCIAGCLFALPYLGTVILLPIRSARNGRFRDAVRLIQELSRD
jgi:hypothetical protein